MEFVQPVAAPDFINLPVDKKDEPKNKQGHVAASAAVAVAVGSTAAAHELDRSIEVRLFCWHEDFFSAFISQYKENLLTAQHFMNIY